MTRDMDHIRVAGGNDDPAGLVITNARIFDGSDLLDVDTVALDGGTITSLGMAGEVLSGSQRTGTEVVDAGGALLGPGFIDAHVHAVFGGLERLGCDLSDAVGPDDCLRVIAAFAAGSPTEWISGGGWTMSDFPGGTPRAADLDRIVGDRGVYLLNRDHHSAWVNTVALERAGIGVGTPDPAGGRIERDAQGHPSGTLHEAAMDLVGNLIPQESPADLRRGLLEGQRYLHSFGITGWQDAIVGTYSGHADPYDAYRAADAAGELTGEVVGAMWWPRDVQDIGEQVRRFGERRREAATGSRFRTTAVKFMLDGIIESRTAAMAEPYHSCGCPGAERGVNYFDPEFLAAAIGAIDAAGLDVHLHAIGDRAVGDGLDALAAARRANPAGDGRHHIAHLQVIDPHDIPRFGEWGVTANMQALWACNDEAMRELTVPVLGPERSSWQYPFRSLLDAGAPLAMGSDWPVSTPDPWQAIHTAVTRTEAGKPVGSPALIPEQSLGLLDALRAYTAGSARLNRTAAGRIAVGAPADLALADRDPFAASANDLATTSTLMTIAGGHIVHDARH